ncbi:hypothetical protein DFH08DRAFT_802013 [Mycena albidolilacea]|uniref:Uncharacterized protein n=1 Tax=Mycena albidolilacea TaxID=1033008 RepID=A0AAD7AGI3_9AGAR|nr:hypothetical protein DFH08DRAFT_802013 [Mycena albidolilacea]
MYFFRLWSHEEPPPGGSAKLLSLHVSLVNCMEFMTKCPPPGLTFAAANVAPSGSFSEKAKIKSSFSPFNDPGSIRTSNACIMQLFGDAMVNKHGPSATGSYFHSWKRGEDGVLKIAGLGAGKYRQRGMMGRRWILLLDVKTKSVERDTVATVAPRRLAANPIR